MVGEFEDAVWAWELCDLVIHQSEIGFYRCDCDRVRGFCIEEKGLKD